MWQVARERLAANSAPRQGEHVVCDTQLNKDLLIALVWVIIPYSPMITGTNSASDRHNLGSRPLPVALS